MVTLSPPRRITRASLARFAHAADEASRSSRTAATRAWDEDRLPVMRRPSVMFGADIEDAVMTNSPPRKRKRETIVTRIKRPQDTATDNAVTAVKAETEEVETKDTIKLEPDPEATSDERTTVAAKTVSAVAAAKPTTRKPARKPARKTIDPDTQTPIVSPPSNWAEIYALVKEMRTSGTAANAAVDTMGCERLADKTASPRDQRFQTLVALMLSSQTKDTANAIAMRRLQTELPPHRPGSPAGLNLENMLAVAPERLDALIRVVGFHNKKTVYLKKAALILRDSFAADIPDSIDGLTSLPGVGPKMAHLCLSVAWGRTEGIGVDVHVHRITNLWGWQSPPTRTPEATRLALQAWLPRDKWHEINWLLVGLGQAVCLPVERRCGDCAVGLAGLCRAADRGKVSAGRKVRAEGGDEDVKGELEVEVKMGSVVVKKEEALDGDLEKEEESVSDVESKTRPTRKRRQ